MGGCTQQKKKITKLLTPGQGDLRYRKGKLGVNTGKNGKRGKLLRLGWKDKCLGKPMIASWQGET